MFLANNLNFPVLALRPDEEIQQKDDYNLNISRYIDTQDPEDAQDIDAHLKGGIPNADIEALTDYWQVCPTLKDAFSNHRHAADYSELSSRLMK